MEVWKRNVVSGKTCNASFEGWGVICEVGDNHFHNLGREPRRSKFFLGECEPLVVSASLSLALERY